MGYSATVDLYFMTLDGTKYGIGQIGPSSFIIHGRHTGLILVPQMVYLIIEVDDYTDCKPICLFNGVDPAVLDTEYFYGNQILLTGDAGG